MKNLIGWMVFFVATVQGWSAVRFQPDAPIDLVKPTFLDTNIHQLRFRRSVDNDFKFPEQLLVNVTTVTLVLTYNHVNGPPPPVYEFDKNGKLVERKVKINTRYAFYQDVNTWASFLVACNSSTVENCSLDGSFYSRGHKISMRPHESFASTGLHEAQSRKSDSNQPVNDYADDIADTTKILAPESGGPDESSAYEEKQGLPGDVHIVETLAFPDEAIYESFLESEGCHALAEEAMTRYLGLIFNEIDLHYVSIPMIDPRISIRVALAGIIIAKDSLKDAPWSHYNTLVINGTTYLNADWAIYNFTNWLNGYLDENTNRDSFPTHDHAMGLTGKDLAYIEDDVLSNILGYAFISGICDYIDTSITEVVGHRIAQTLAHELGHNLGAYHDESERCPATNLNIMTAYLWPYLEPDESGRAQAEWTFSPCSIDDMISYIQGLSNNCLLQHDTISSTALDEPRSLPGEFYTLDQQCQFYRGPSAVSCENDARVANISCYAGFECGYLGSSCDQTEYPLYPFAGTPCEGGNSSESHWCYKGRCWPRSFSPTQTPTPGTTTEDPCTRTCCILVQKRRQDIKRCCRGRRCCKKRWGQPLSCCQLCPWKKRQ